ERRDPEVHRRPRGQLLGAAEPNAHRAAELLQTLVERENRCPFAAGEHGVIEIVNRMTTEGCFAEDFVREPGDLVECIHEIQCLIKASCCLIDRDPSSAYGC